MASHAAADSPSPQQQLRIDQEALLLMLSYVEAECARLGAREAAHHAALAAALLPQSQPWPWGEARPGLPQ